VTGAWCALWTSVFSVAGASDDDRALRWLEHPDAPEVVDWSEQRTQAALAWLEEVEPGVDAATELVGRWRRYRSEQASLSDIVGDTRLWTYTRPDPTNEGETDYRLWKYHYNVVVERNGDLLPLSLDGLEAESWWRPCGDVLSLDGTKVLWGRRIPPPDPTKRTKKSRGCHVYVTDITTGERTQVSDGHFQSAYFHHSEDQVVLRHRNARRTLVVAHDLYTGDEAVLMRRPGKWALSQLASGPELIWRGRGLGRYPKRWRPVSFRADGHTRRLHLRGGGFSWVGWDDGHILLRVQTGKKPERLVRIDPEKSRRRHWETILEEDELRPWSAMYWFHDRFFVVTKVDGVRVATEHDRSGEVLGEPLDGPFSGVWVAHAWRDEPLVRAYSPRGSENWVRKPTGEYEPVRDELLQLDADFSSVLATSPDGTEVPVSVVAPKGFEPDGTAPVWLKVYGGFGSGVQAGVGVVEAIWLDMGGVVATVHARGGDERGEEWHEQAKKENLGKTYEDVIAAGQWFVDQGWTQEGKLAISGFSNGGLTAAVCGMRAPHLFGAVDAGAGVYDLIRGPAMGRWWPDEYGRPSDSDQREVLLGLSPVHATPEHLPAVFLTTGHTDPTVTPSHSYKLQAAWEGLPGGPVLLRVWPFPSHLGHMSESKQKEWRESMTVEQQDRLGAERLLFLMRALDLDPSLLHAPPAPPTAPLPPR
jgi:hypothetical protein